ncbi:SulP family inorganic anion transporter [Poseidonibacter lekithochrous]|uniref:SulP family inorganic anion transporter n=1 Tax=Poseidonibacter TaxID=2321187 RepID=UPI001C08EA2A|nr:MULTISPECIES: SulP family inorganic anion transporter [Poseidonibacter]MBU3014799.1 SulP family inorganic anion transporter [Poseidonibacter lekithochrous]MDO6828097.1 SulP family inorganic anion transporter [Poseidonibacter sp. 1_MG-2023]
MLNIKDTFIGKNAKSDILSGLVVAVALVPEAIAFSFIAQVSPIVGLYAAFILGLITALMGGKPGMISGATGAVAIVLVGVSLAAKEILIAQGLSGDAISFGIVQYITLTAIVAGIIQITIGAFKMGKFIRLVPQPALHGFVNGLAVVIATSQFKFLDGAGIIMYAIILGTMATMYFLPKFTAAIPAGLIAIIVFTLGVYITGADTKLVGDLANLTEFKGLLPSFHIPDVILDVEALKLVLPYAVIVALVGVIESLLTLSVLDEISGTRGSANQECIAQGTGNITCGLFGAMPGCAMIGQSIINYTSGGLGRLSGVVASIGLILLVATLTDLLNIIPVAILVGIMFMVSIGTFEWSSFSRITKMPKSDAFVLITVTLITIVADLAIAVISGVIISALVFAWKHAKVTARTHREDNGTKIYDFDGPLFFGSVTAFNDNFDIKHDPENVVLDFKNARVMDISGVEAVDAITKKYLEAGKTVKIRHLSAECKSIMKNAGQFCTYEEDDPKYKVAYDY